MERSHQLVEQSRRALKASGDCARLARRRIDRSRALLTRSGNCVVLSASTVTAARLSVR